MVAPSADAIHKYPRTRHIEGSRLQEGDEDLEMVPFHEIAGRHLVVEEKVDGSNTGISFTKDGDLRLQSRGHYLTGGRREGQFALFKAWAPAHAEPLWRALGPRHVLFGEWLYAKHTIFYDALPHYFLEFDILDLETGEYLSTPRRRALLEGVPVASVPVVQEGPLRTLEELKRLVRPSLYKTPRWKDRLRELAAEQKLDPERILRETDPAESSEGLYIKAEEGGAVAGRYKWIRPGFLQAVLGSQGHWADRPIVPNQLAPGTDIFAP